MSSGLIEWARSAAAVNPTYVIALCTAIVWLDVLPTRDDATTAAVFYRRQKTRGGGGI